MPFFPLAVGDQNSKALKSKLLELGLVSESHCSQEQYIDIDEIWTELRVRVWENQESGRKIYELYYQGRPIAKMMPGKENSKLTLNLYNLHRNLKTESSPFLINTLPKPQQNTANLPVQLDSEPKLKQSTSYLILGYEDVLGGQHIDEEHTLSENDLSLHESSEKGRYVLKDGVTIVGAINALIDQHGHKVMFHYEASLEEQNELLSCLKNACVKRGLQFPQILMSIKDTEFNSTIIDASAMTPTDTGEIECDNDQFQHNRHRIKRIVCNSNPSVIEKAKQAGHQSFLIGPSPNETCVTLKHAMCTILDNAIRKKLCDELTAYIQETTDYIEKNPLKSRLQTRFSFFRNNPVLNIEYAKSVLKDLQDEQLPLNQILLQAREKKRGDDIVLSHVQSMLASISNHTLADGLDKILREALSAVENDTSCSFSASS